MSLKLSIIACCLALWALTYATEIGNIPKQCWDCICDADSSCTNKSFKFSFDYWRASGKVTKYGQAITQGNEYIECTEYPLCTEKTVQEYVTRNEKDCNGDGIIDCDDYLRIHLLGDRCTDALPTGVTDTYNKCKAEAFPDVDIVPKDCLKCICDTASGCNTTASCDSGVCGPYRISWVYWAEGGKKTVDGQPITKGVEFANCVNDITCAEKTIQGYMRRYRKDCDRDGVLDCVDFARIHFMGPFGCARSSSYRNMCRNAIFRPRYNIVTQPAVREVPGKQYGGTLGKGIAAAANILFDALGKN